MTIRDHLQAIHDQHGRLTPELVVETARPKGHALHASVFDRAPREAAEAWYRHRAHELIRSVAIVYKETDDGPRRVRAFHAVRTEDGHVYEPAEAIAADPLLRAMVLRDMEREWRQLKARYGHMQEFISMISDALELAA